MLSHRQNVRTLKIALKSIEKNKKIVDYWPRLYKILI